MFSVTSVDQGGYTEGRSRCVAIVHGRFPQLHAVLVLHLCNRQILPNLTLKHRPLYFLPFAYETQRRLGRGSVK